MGEWDATWEGGSGINSVTRIFDDWVIQERFSGFPTSADDQPFHGLRLHLVERLFGRQVAESAARYMEYRWNEN